MIKQQKHVHFNVTPTIIHEPFDLIDELKQYRKCNALQRKADAARLENILSPILTVIHRQIIWEKLHNL